MTIPYSPPKPTESSEPTPGAKQQVPGRHAIWVIAGIAFCFGGLSLMGTWSLWSNRDALSELDGVVFWYYQLRPLLFAVGLLGLAWNCVVYADAITHNAFNSELVRATHGRLWNWFAALLVTFAAIAVSHWLLI